MKKLFSVLLCVTLLLSVFAVTASASDEVLTSVFFASDAQFYKSYTQTAYGSAIENCFPVVDTLVGLAKENGHEIETFVFGGDYTQNEPSVEIYDPNWKEIFGNNREWHYGNDPKYGIAGIKNAIANHYTTSDDNILFGQGNHEPDITTENDWGLAPGGAYEFDEYVVYMINDQDLAGPRPRTEKNPPSIALDASGNKTITPIANPEAVVTKTANDLKAYLDNMIAQGDDRPVFIASHQPLYSERTKDYNCYAYLIADVVNEAAKKLDIVFFFGHTHQAVDQIGGGLSYVGKGETLKVSNNTAITAETDGYTLTDNDYKEYTLNFTYMNFGHLARYRNAVNNDILSSTVIDITPTELRLTRYHSKASYASEDEKILDTKVITRVNPKKETIVIDGNGETKYLEYDEVFTIPSGTVYTNGTIITRGDAKVMMNGLEVTGDISFNAEGKISPVKDWYVKIIDGTTNTILFTVNADNYDNYPLSLINRSNNNRNNVEFDIDPIYSGNVMLRLDITDVPEDADLGLIMG